MKTYRLALMIVFGMVLSVCAGENDWFKPLGKQPKAAPRRINSGESVAPLPLPATPLRRSERKREPSPPKLLAKIVWGESAQFDLDNGQKTKIADWNLCPADVQSLLDFAAKPIGVRYGYDTLPIEEFNGDPSRTPIVFYSGSRSIRFSDEQLQKIRAYVLRGGMVVCDDITGSPYFYNSFKLAMLKAFPTSKIRTVPADHPIYHMMGNATHVSYAQNNSSRKPFLEGIYIGSRIGVLISKYGLGCGWDGHGIKKIDQAVCYDVNSSKRLGVNLVAYAIGYADAGREEAKPELFGTLDEKTPTDEFVFGQIKHDGAWNVHPGGSAALLRRLRQSTSMRVSLKRVAVDLDKDDLSNFTFLYLTGLDDFELDARATAQLRNFLDGTGTLFINNGLGLKTFDGAVQRELRKILPEATLEPIPLTHPIYGSVFDIQGVRYTPAVLGSASQAEQPVVPQLMGISIRGDLRVIYSPFDMEAGWMGCEYPLAKAFQPDSSVQMGVNLAMYAMTH